jgi:hypothetical protein
MTHEPSDPPRPDPEIAEHQRELLTSLFRELFQAERSAELHGEREARRLGMGSPASALHAVAAHARRAHRELEGLAGDEEVRLRDAAGRVGALLSNARHLLLDRLVDRERSFRATLLGLRHGLDTVRMLRHVADAAGRVELGGFCTRWLEEREPLVADVERSMSWFAHHPGLAAERVSWWSPRARRRRPAAAPG